MSKGEVVGWQESGFRSQTKSGYYPVHSIKAILALMTTGNNADNDDNWQQC